MENPAIVLVAWKMIYVRGGADGRFWGRFLFFDCLSFVERCVINKNFFR